MKTKRVAEIDFLRAEGLLLIVLAHVNAPAVLFQMRNFDVVLMVFVIGMAYANSTPIRYRDYVVKRFRRLVIPVWLFLIPLLVFLYFLKIKFSPSGYLSSFLLLSGEPGWGGRLCLDFSSIFYSRASIPIA